MRMKPRATIEDSIRLLSPEQREAFQSVRLADQAVTTQRKRALESMDALRHRIVVALDAGVPVGILSPVLGLSRARIYQMRDEAPTSGRLPALVG